MKGEHGLMRQVVAMLAGAALLVSACGTDETPQGAAPGPPPPALFPLSGQPVGDRTAEAARPALVVKIDNDNTNARPQQGVRDADVVYEEKVEGSVSRFAAVFHSHDPAEIGPVRSGRTTDIAIVSSLNRPLYAYSGANPRTMGQLAQAPLVDVGYGAVADAYERRSDRSAPYNLWTFPDRLRRRTPDGAAAPAPAFAFGDAPAPGAVPATSVTYQFGPRGTSAVFTWDAGTGRWNRTQNGTPHVDTADEPLGPRNVIIQLVEYVDTGDADVAGAPVPEAQLSGEGAAWVLTRGTAVKTTWRRPDLSRPTELGPPGAPIQLAPGQTWIALVPADAGAIVSGADGAALP